jgi:hypothetical protein
VADVWAIGPRAVHDQHDVFGGHVVY